MTRTAHSPTPEQRAQIRALATTLVGRASMIVIRNDPPDLDNFLTTLAQLVALAEEHTGCTLRDPTPLYVCSAAGCAGYPWRPSERPHPCTVSA